MRVSSILFDTFFLCVCGFDVSWTFMFVSLSVLCNVAACGEFC